ncbi:M20/M25/M40 family metallo-hydrolase [Nonomuraea mesophila]|uniref:M20/M25/M40 family metallo-hydrolase n=1 Tax=Nonomuraea mesophila TaxID=2530382 RepID=A0A4R5E6X4_9ACTN|nr:M28 family peptidase [Nonomuraea mesophila]TDE26576.1 M20/M25/M40 family metallo-hydrolase [Nonomuraea mesophila]
MRRIVTALIAALALPLPLLSGPVTGPASAQAAGPADTYADRLVRQVRGANVEEHLRALQAIATAHGGNRAAGTTGYDASRDYVVGKLRAAGYKVTFSPVEFVESWTENSPPVLTETAPGRREYVPKQDFFAFEPSPAGDVTAQVQAVDLTLPPAATPSSTSGCEASDFDGFVAGRIALIQRGTCAFSQKVRNAKAAGAAAIIVFNEGQEGRTEAEQLDIGEWRAGIPMVYADFAVGERLAAARDATVRLTVDSTVAIGTDHNVIAETRAGDPDNVVMLGAHLDSVPAGPGINDNGSGTAAILEVAEEMARFPVRNRVRFTFWAAEELGLLGSDQYVSSLPQSERDRIRLYLNFDMVASPNFAYKLYDGDDSDDTGAAAGPPGSAQIERQFQAFYRSRDLPTVGTDFDGRSDYGPFIAVGIPAGGIFTGAEGVKTAAEARLFGGTAGTAYDSCYHQACDTIGNIDTTALDVNADAIADSAARFAFDLRSIPRRTAPATRGEGS